MGRALSGFETYPASVSDLCSCSNKGSREMMHLFVTSVNAATAEGRVKLWKGEHRESRRPLQSECLDRIKALLFFAIPCIH